MRNMRIVAFVGILFLLFSKPALAYEQITSFRSDIHINADSTITVTETISVEAEGIDIKRGIYRDIPTKYTNALGMKSSVPFILGTVLKDGVPEPHHIENQQNGIRIYLGSSDVFLPTGAYTYQITYTMGNMLGYFETYDELYYNITGNGWAFPINSAEAHITLPTGVSQNDAKMVSFTGPEGSTTSQAQTEISNIGGHTVAQATTSFLGRYEGLTVAVKFPKGYVYEPTRNELLRQAIADNVPLFATTIGTLLLAIYYITVWKKYGKDPTSTLIVARFEPPERTEKLNGEKYLSAGLTRMVHKMGYDDKVLTVTLIQMAIKGVVTLTETKQTFTVTPISGKHTSLSPEEKIVYEELFPENVPFTFSQSRYAKIAKLRSAITKHFRTLAEPSLYFNNRTLLIFPAILSAVILFTLVVLTAPEHPEAVFMGVWLSVWSMGVYGLLAKIKDSIKNRSYFTSVGLVLFSVPFLLGELFGIWVLIMSMSILGALVFVSHPIMFLWFYQALKARTKEGRYIQDQSEGLRMYLLAAEKRRYEMLHKTIPDSIAMYEKYLPYAVALDIEPQWAKTLDYALKEREDATPNTYHPAWFTGTKSYSAANVTRAISTGMANHISSSSRPPGSSSGFSGGSSGGGGGGGGGGGW